MSVRPLIAPGRRLRIAKRPPESIRPSMPRPARRDCHGRLVSAIVAMAGDGAVLIEGTLRPWCSATFVGARHHLVIAVGGEDAAERTGALAQALPDAEFRIPGHVIADLAVEAIIADADQARLVLSVLSIEDW